jgi:hypothetical protein
MSSKRLATPSKTTTPIIASTTFATPNTAFAKAMRKSLMVTLPYNYSPFRIKQQELYHILPHYTHTNDNNMKITA